MRERVTDTIFAPATPVNGTITILRLSGPGCRFVLETMAGPTVPPPRLMTLRALRDGSGEVLDKALVVFFPGPESFTGEDCAELHLHGGRAVLAAVVRRLSELPGLRPAQPGEFSRRAFLNNRMDLTEAEGLADLLKAETDAQRRQALSLLGGRLGQTIAGWRDRLVEMLALAEADLDFSDERDVPEGLGFRVTALAVDVRRQIDAALADAARGERVRDGYRVVIAGPPNAGKSSLLNALAQRDVAIVTDIAGTTRDLIEVRCDIAGAAVTFIDTAGLRDSNDPVERIGMSRTRDAASGADLIFWLSPVDDPSAPPADMAGAVVVTSKADTTCRGDALSISVKRDDGLDPLLQYLAERLDSYPQQLPALVSRQRHVSALKDCRDALLRIEASEGGLPELIAEDARLALASLGSITGQVSSEDILDRIFGAFCIGK